MLANILKLFRFLYWISKVSPFCAKAFALFCLASFLFISFYLFLHFVLYFFHFFVLFCLFVSFFSINSCFIVYRNIYYASFWLSTLANTHTGTHTQQAINFVSIRVSGRYIKLTTTTATLKLVAAAANCVAKLVVVLLHFVVVAVVAWRCADKFHKTKTTTT